MKNFKLFMKAVGEETPEEVFVGIILLMISLLAFLCIVYPIFFLVIITIGSVSIIADLFLMFSKWSKKVMKKYKQLKGENNGKI